MVAQPNNIIQMDENGEVQPLPAKSLAGKMARVMLEVSRLPKTGKNAHFNYDYATESDILDTIRPLMAKQGIALFPTILSTEEYEKGKNIITRVLMSFELVCSDTGESRVCQWVGDALDNQDKGINKAVTAAEKYFILKTFMVSTGNPKDDPDSGLEAKKKREAEQRQNAPERDLSQNGNTQGAEHYLTTSEGQQRLRKLFAELTIEPDQHEYYLKALGVSKFSETKLSEADLHGKIKSLHTAWEAQQKATPPAQPKSAQPEPPAVEPVEPDMPPVDTTLDDHFGPRKEDAAPTQASMPEVYEFDMLTVSTFKSKSQNTEDYKLTFRTKAKDADGRLIMASTFHYGKYVEMGLLTEEQLMKKETIPLVGVTGQIEQTKDKKYWNVVDGTVKMDVSF